MNKPCDVFRLTIDHRSALRLIEKLCTRTDTISAEQEDLVRFHTIEMGARRIEASRETRGRGEVVLSVKIQYGVD